MANRTIEFPEGFVPIDSVDSDIPEGFVSLDEPTPEPDIKPFPIGEPVAIKRQRRPGVWGFNQEMDGMFSGEDDITDLLPADVSYDFGRIVGMTANPKETKDKMMNSLYYSVELGLPLNVAYNNENTINSILFGKGTTPTTARGRIANRYKAGKTEVQSMDLGYEILKETWQDWAKFDEQLKNFEKLQGQVPEDVRKDFRGFFEKTIGATAGQLPILWQTMKEGGPAAVGGGLIGGMIAGVGSVALPTIGEEPIAIGAGVKIGATVGAALFGADRIRELEAGGMFVSLATMKDVMGNRIDPRYAVVASHAVGAINGGIEIGQWGVLLGTFGIAPEVFKKAAGKVTRKLVGDKVMNSVIAKSLLKYGVALGAETFQEVEQETTNIVFEEMAKELNNARKGTEFKPITAEDLKARYSEVTTESLRAFGVILAPGVGISGAMEAIKAKSDLKADKVKVGREKGKVIIEVEVPEGKELVEEEISPGVELRQIPTAKVAEKPTKPAAEALKPTEPTITAIEGKEAVDSLSEWVRFNLEIDDTLKEMQKVSGQARETLRDKLKSLQTERDALDLGHKVRKMTPEEIAEDEEFHAIARDILNAGPDKANAALDILEQRIGLLTKVSEGILTQEEADIITAKFVVAAKLRIPEPQRKQVISREVAPEPTITAEEQALVAAEDEALERKVQQVEVTKRVQKSITVGTLNFKTFDAMIDEDIRTNVPIRIRKFKFLLERAKGEALGSGKNLYVYRREISGDYIIENSPPSYGGVYHEVTPEGVVKKVKAPFQEEEYLRFREKVFKAEVATGKQGIPALPKAGVEGEVEKGQVDVFHTTDKDFTEFKIGKTGAVFFATSKSDAEAIGRKTFQPEKQKIVTARLNLDNTFDYENPAHVDELTSILEKNNIDLESLEEMGITEYASIREAIEDGNWELIEAHSWRLKKAGFDSFWINNTVGGKDIGVLDTSKITPAPPAKAGVEKKKPAIEEVPEAAEIKKLTEKAKVLSRQPHKLTEAQEKELDRIEGKIDKLSGLEEEAVEEKRFVSKEAYEKAKKRITDRDIIRMGLDPKGFADMVVIGAYHIERGVRAFAEWSELMINEYGAKIKPELKRIWDGAQKKIEEDAKKLTVDKREWLVQFDKYDDVTLNVPDDIHHEELIFEYEEKEPFKPKAKKSVGLTKAELDILGPEFSSLVRWAQIHDEPIGYKQGVADRAVSAKSAIDRLRMASKIRKQHRVDAANLVYTYVPRGYRGDFLKRAIAIRTPLNAERFADAIELWVKEFEFREAIKKIKKLKKAVEKDTKHGEIKYGRLPPGLREKVKGLLDYDMAQLTDMKKKRLKSRKQWMDRVAETVIGGLTELPADIDEKFADEYKDFTVINQNLIDEMHRLEQQNIHEISIEQINSAIEQVEKLLLEHAKKGKSRFRRRFEKWHKKKTSAVNEIFQRKTGEKWTKATGWVKEAATVDQYNIRSLVGSATGLENENMLDLLYDALVESDHERVKLYKTSVEAWQKEVHAAKITADDLKALEELVTVTISGKELELSRDDLLTIYGYTIADGTLKRLLTTDGLNIITHRLKGIKGAFGMTSQEYRVDTPSVQELRDIADQVLPKHKKLLDIHFKIAREYGGPAINKVSIEVQNTEIADTRADARYLAVHREFSNRFSGEKMSDTAKATEMLGRFQPRKGGKQRMNIRAFTQEVMAGLQANALYSSMTIPMMEARSLLASRDFTDKMQKYGHKKVLENLSTLYNRMLAYGTDAATMDLVFASFFSQAGKSILSLRLTGAAIQAASIPASYGVIERKFFSFAKPTKAEINEMEEKYPSLWLRWKGRQFDYALGTLTAARGFKTMIMETTDLTDKFLNHYTWGDQLAIYNILKAAERMTAEKHKPGTKEYEAALLKTFDRAMETQPMWDVLHRSKLTTDAGFFAKGFSMFMSARAAQFNVIVQAINDFQRNRISKTEMYKRIAHIGHAAMTVSFIRQMIRKGIEIAGIGFFTALGLRKLPDEDELKKIVKDLAIKLPTETIFNMTGLNIVGAVINAAVVGGIRASNYKWGAYDARNLRTGNFGVDIFVDMMTTGIEGVEFMTDLLTLKENRSGEFAFYDSGERFIRDIMVLTAYRLGLPLSGPVSDIYYPLKRAYSGSKGKNRKRVK